MGGRPRRCLTGEVFERLTVLEETGDVGRRGKHYLCRCDCGNTTLAWHDSLVRSEKRSCGCLFRDSVEKSKEDGRNNRNSRHPLYDRFRKMISRCYNPKDGVYESYGAQGIQVCNEWLGPEGFATFLLEMGLPPEESFTLDRIDPYGNYSKENCRWASKSMQVFNRRDTSQYRTGVSLSESGKRFRAYISFNKKKYNLGTYDTVEEAIEAREVAELYYYGELLSKQ